MKEISCRWFLDGLEENIFYNNFRYSQGDNIIPTIELLTDFDLSEMTVNAFFCLPNGTIIIQDEVTVSGNLVTFQILEQALVLAGMHKIEITLNGQNEEQLTLPNGIKYEVVEVKSYEGDVLLPSESQETVSEIYNSLTIAISTGQSTTNELQAKIDQADIKIDALDLLLNQGATAHIITDETEVAQPHRSTMKFIGAVATDDSENDRTIVTVTSSTYVHNQVASLSAWTINHNLNKYPSVSVVDSGGSQVIGEVQYITTNQVILTFSSEFSGKAYLN